MTATETALNSLGELKQDWDSYGAPPINPKCIEAARLILQVIQPEVPPWIVPTCNGGVQIEWHSFGVDLEIEIDPEDASLSGLVSRSEQ